MAQSKQYTIPIPHPAAIDHRVLGLALHHMQGLQFWWLSASELIVSFDQSCAESGVMKCRNLVNGN